MDINFFKYQGTGNDFILLDNRTGIFEKLDFKAIEQLCDRRFGIGADGLMLLQQHPEFDFEMLYFNADGNPGSMCGNGGRCIVAFAKALGIITEETNFLAVDGPHYARISENDDVALKMIDVDTITKDDNAFVLNTGSPHYIKIVNGLAGMDVFTDGSAIRNNSTYKEKGINVNFVEPHGSVLHVRTFERGVEDETYACGTGVTAAALAMACQNNETGSQQQKIKVLGGELEVTFDRDGDHFTNIFLKGPAKLVFQGTIPQP